MPDLSAPRFERTIPPLSHPLPLSLSLRARAHHIREKERER